MVIQLEKVIQVFPLHLNTYVVALQHIYIFSVQNNMKNPYPAKLIYLNFHPLDVVSRYRDPQLQVGEKILIVV